MAQFWCAPSDWLGAEACLDLAESRHARDAMRLRCGDAIRIFDGVGRAAEGIVRALAPRVVVGDLVLLAQPVLSPVFLQVAVALLPNEAMQEAVVGLTEYGCDTFLPMTTERSGVRLSVDRRESKLEQWRRAARVVCKQSHRRLPLQIAEIQSFDAVVHAAARPTERRYLADWAEDALCLREAARGIVMNSASEAPVRITVLIGPEGGWTDSERTEARGAGWVPVSLGNEILRAESAACLVAAGFKVLLR